MSNGQRSILIWVALILLAAYLMGVNVALLINSIMHALQSVHNANAH